MSRSVKMRVEIVLRAVCATRVGAIGAWLVPCGLLLEVAAGCTPTSSTSTSDAGSSIAASFVAAPAPNDYYVDCVGVLGTRRMRGFEVANAKRFGEDNPALRTSYRLGQLPASDLATFCDWQACIATNGYSHVCGLNDAGWERCHVCDGSADCGGAPLNQADCVAHTTDPDRAGCHVGLLQECLLQRAIRGPADPRVTQTCAWSDQACAGQLAGDLSSQALAAQSETQQVIIEIADDELARSAQLTPDAAIVTYWQQQLSLWDGGLPEGDVDTGADANLEAGDSD
jgi:hypothetical protein